MCLAILGSAPESFAAAPSALDALIDKTLADGTESRVPSPIAELLGVAKDAPVLDEEISQDQATDSMRHLFRLLVERLPDTGEAKPAGLLLRCHQFGRGEHQDYIFKASLGGKLEKAVVISGKNDAQGNSVKGLGTSAQKDISSPEVKKRFQHELDLWLKKSYLKKEWRAADFSGGVLKK